NGGAGSGLRGFSNYKKEGAEIINNKAPGGGLSTPPTPHPPSGTRRYLYKGEKAQKKKRRR
ncbi:membrane-bound lytic murein transglycosylase MltC, partial [Enterobacter hormaechei]|nr:membrane-bound lytic murein transglycosylase MltC [Enterobacter hormaechei]